MLAVVAENKIAARGYAHRFCCQRFSAGLFEQVRLGKTEAAWMLAVEDRDLSSANAHATFSFGSGFISPEPSMRPSCAAISLPVRSGVSKAPLLSISMFSPLSGAFCARVLLARLAALRSRQRVRISTEHLLLAATLFYRRNRRASCFL